jgi:hypothetical protein
MKLRVVLFLAAAFLGAALALHALSGCSDDDAEPVDPVDCDAFCNNDCWTRAADGVGCKCGEFIGDPPVCTV